MSGDRLVFEKAQLPIGVATGRVAIQHKQQRKSLLKIEVFMDSKPDFSQASVVVIIVR